MFLARTCSTQIRFGPMGGVLGFDLAAVLSVAERMGFDATAMAMLIGGCERGMLEGQRHATD
ncbi:MAG: DUF7697 family protein [Geminicoccaceae bacterium]